VRHNPIHACETPEFVRELIAANPWATLVSVNDGRSVASHYPILLDDSTDELAIVTHVGRPDERIHEFGDREMLVIVQGRHGYISPSWYAPGATRAPTWNFSVAHCYGVPEVLSPEENLRVLTRLVNHFERCVEQRPNAGRNGHHRVVMRHGVATVTSGQRTALGVIFHDAR
jgi:transcriptional regulator